MLAKPTDPPGPRYDLATVGDLEIERRLHDLTLDFGVVTTATLSRPLQRRGLGTWQLCLWVPKSLCTSEAQAQQALKERRLPLALAVGESALAGMTRFRDTEPRLSCPSFLAARAALERGGVAALLPDFLVRRVPQGSCWRLTGATLDAPELEYRLAWNPRLARSNPHIVQRREWLLESLTARMRERRR